MDRVVVGTVAMDRGVVCTFVVHWVVVGTVVVVHWVVVGTVEVVHWVVVDVVVHWVVVDVVVDQGVPGGMVDLIVVGGVKQINPSVLRLVWSLFQIWKMLEY